MQTYSRDLRERIIAARNDGHSAQEVARLFRVSKRSVERFWKQFNTNGTIEPAQRGGYRRSRLQDHDQTLRAWISEKKDLTLAEIQSRVALDLGIQLGTTALWHRLEQLGLSYKKNAARCRARPGRPPGRPPKLERTTKEMGA